MASNEQIINFLNSNPGATDAQIRQNMDAYGVTPAQLAGATGKNAADITSRYDAAGAPARPAPVVPQAAPMREYQKSPYLDSMAAGITSQMNDNWSRNTAPSLRSGAMAAGGFGGSRQGVVEANAANDMNRSLGQNLTNLYGQDYQQQMGRNLQEFQGNQQFALGQGNLGLGNRQLDNNAAQGRNSYDLGLRSNDLGFANLDYNINQGNFNNQLAGANFGLNVQNSLQAGNNLGLTAGNNIQNTPMDYQKYFGNSANAAGGLGGQGSSTGPGQQGSPLTGALGGYQLANAWNNSRTNSAGNNPYTGSNPYTQYGNGVGSYLGGNGASWADR